MMDTRQTFLNKIIDYRKEVIQAVEETPGKVFDIRKRAQDDPIYFINVFAWTFDPRKRPAHIPFILYDHQIELVEWIETRIQNKEDGLVEKTRDMGATWTILSLYLQHWLFDDGFLAHLGSRKEECVDKSNDINSLFERLRFMLYYLPPWLIPRGYDKRKHDMHLRLYNSENGNVITGESANKDFGRQARASVVLLDEFASWEQDEESWMAVSQVAPCKIVLSTPKGKQNAFARLRWKSNIKIKTLSWKEHPEKSIEWYEKLKSSGELTSHQFASEIDIDYVASAGNPVYPEFDRNKHIRDYQFDKDKPLIRGIDFGRNHPACVFCQEDVDKNIWQFYELLGNNILIQDFGLIIKYVSGEIKDESGMYGLGDNEKGEYKNVSVDYQIDRIRSLCRDGKIEGVHDISHLQVFMANQYQDYCDSAGNQKSDKSPQTSIDILSSMGFKLQYRPARVDEGINTLGKLLIMNSYYVTTSCPLTIEGFCGGYHRDDKGEPFKDFLYEHIMDALRYIIHIRYMYIDKKVVETLNPSQTLIEKGFPPEMIQEIEKMRKAYVQEDREYEINKLRKETGGMCY